VYATFEHWCKRRYHQCSLNFELFLILKLAMTLTKHSGHTFSQEILIIFEYWYRADRIWQLLFAISTLDDNFTSSCHIRSVAESTLNGMVACSN
jgi:hypothetical protein